MHIGRLMTCTSARVWSVLFKYEMKRKNEKIVFTPMQHHPSAMHWTIQPIDSLCVEWGKLHYFIRVWNGKATTTMNIEEIFSVCFFAVFFFFVTHKRAGMLTGGQIQKTEQKQCDVCGWETKTLCVRHAHCSYELDYVRVCESVLVTFFPFISYSYFQYIFFIIADNFLWTVFLMWKECSVFGSNNCNSQ